VEIYGMSPTGRFHEVLRFQLACQWARMASVNVMVGSEMQLRLADDHQPVVDVAILPFEVLPPDARGADMLLIFEMRQDPPKSDAAPKMSALLLGVE
jgi:hypothetical protein